MSKDIKLGTKPVEGQLRDAIHVAIAPMVASTQLKPGAHVGILPDGTAGMSDNPIGIVDPFIGGSVYKGERFWLLLYQQTVTGMRHQWSHPAFPDASVETGDEKSNSIEWLKAFARTMGTNYEHMMDDIRNGDSILVDESRSDDTVNPLVSHHYKIVTGVDPGEIYFRCAC